MSTTTIEHRRLSNTEAPISRLNDDILSKIFMLNTQLDFDHPHIPSITVRRTSHVYQRWRDLILNYPIIWAASLDFYDSMPWMQIVILRAGETPLDIVLPSVSRFVALVGEETRSKWRICPPSIIYLHRRFGLSSTDHDLEFALFLLPKARQFTATLRHEEQSHYVARQLSLSAVPHLQELSLATHAHSAIRLWESADTGTSGYAGEGSRNPQLKRLILYGYGTDFMSPTFQNLTYLSAAHLTDERALEAEEWLRILARLSQLEKLRLKKCFVNEIIAPHKERSHLVTTNPIFLPKLQSLVLKGDYGPCHTIFSRIGFPASCAMDVKYSKVDGQHSYSMVSAICSKVQSSVKFRKVTGLFVQIIESKCIQLTNAHHTPANNLSFTWAVNKDVSELVSSFMEVLRIMSPDITDLYFVISGFGGSPRMPSDFHFLKQFGQVRNLRIANDETLHIITRHHLKSGQDSTNTDLILPELSTLSLYDLHFQSQTYVLDIIQFLHQRSEVGSPIKNIMIKSCYGSHMDMLISKLVSIGVEVDWDGNFEPGVAGGLRLYYNEELPSR